MKKTVLALLVLLGVAGTSMPVSAMEHCGTEECCCSPFGSYCKGSEWGWYGARRTVATAADAEKTILRFFLPQKVSVANLKDSKTFFEAEVRGKDNSVLDKVIVDKRTGRIRSIY